MLGSLTVYGLGKAGWCRGSKFEGFVILQGQTVQPFIRLVVDIRDPLNKFMNARVPSRTSGCINMWAYNDFDDSEAWVDGAVVIAATRGLSHAANKDSLEATPSENQGLTPEPKA